MRHHHWPPNNKNEITFLESPLLNFLVEGSENLGLIMLDLLLSLHAFIVQSFQLLESQSMLLLICHLYRQGNAQRWNLDF